MQIKSQGENRPNPINTEIAQSCLNVSSSGVDVSYDLSLSDGKTIAELLYDQTEQ